MSQMLAVIISTLILLIQSALAGTELERLPLKTLVYDDASCSHSHHLYYLPPNFCLGPLYEPASSIRVPGAIPKDCKLTAFADARCKGAQVATYGSGALAIRGRVARRQQQVIIGPSKPDTCFGVGDVPDTTSKKRHEQKKKGANSFFLSCPI